MTLIDILKIVATAVASVGGGGAIVFGLSSFLGKVWANRLMEAERARYVQDLERLRAELHHASEANLASMKSEIDIYKEKHLKGHADKLAIYRRVTDVVVELLGNLDKMPLLNAPQNMIESRNRFNCGRMKVYGYLAMLAPQRVMDAMDGLMDHLILITQRKESYEWPRVRELVYTLLNEVRRDIGIDTTPIEYRGKL